jgi:hypothetical protein
VKLKTFVAILGLLGWATTAPADMVFIFWGPPAEIRLQVGAVSGVTTVTHTVPAAQLGDGTPIVGVPSDVYIEVSARRATFWDALSTSFILSVDASVPLTDGTHVIPFTDISWTSATGDIPAGRFTGSPNQLLLGPISTFWQVSDRHTFYYDNLQVLPAGSYTGRVTYTASIP